MQSVVFHIEIDYNVDLSHFRVLLSQFVSNEILQNDVDPDSGFYNFQTNDLQRMIKDSKLTFCLLKYVQCN